MRYILITGLLLSGIGLTACEKNPKTGEWGVKEFDVKVDTPEEIQHDLNRNSTLPNTGNVSDHYLGTDDLFCPEPQRKRGECK